MVLENLNRVDFVVMVLVVASIYLGARKGFVKSGIALMFWILAFILGLYFDDTIGNIFSFIHTQGIRDGVGFLIIFVVMVLIGVLVTYLCEHLVEKANLYNTDKTLGGLFGIARGVVGFAVLLCLAQYSHMPQQAWYRNSQLIPYFQPLVNGLMSFVPASLQPKIDNEMPMLPLPESHDPTAAIIPDDAHEPMAPPAPAPELKKPATPSSLPPAGQKVSSAAKKPVLAAQMNKPPVPKMPIEPDSLDDMALDEG